MIERDKEREGGRRREEEDLAMPPERGAHHPLHHLLV